MATSTETLTAKPVAPRELGNDVPLPRNIAFSVLDYIIQPLLMLLTAHYFAKTLGISLFGIWILVLAIIGSSGSICTGFGDAALKYVSTMRGRLDQEGVARVIGASAIMNGTLGLALAITLYALAPWAAKRVFHLESDLRSAFVSAARIGTFVLLVRSLSFVFVGALKAFERYQESTQVTVAARVAGAITALLLVWRGFSVAAIMMGTLVCEIAALVMLARAASVLWRNKILISTMSGWRAIASFGFFNWIQAVSGTIFSQADRLLVAALLGPTALSYYGVCVQCAQPIHGLTAAGCNVLFPHLSTHLESSGPSYLRAKLCRAFRINLLSVFAMTLPLVLLAAPILTLWMGRPFSQNAAGTLTLVALSFALLAVNIPGHYALMALGEVRFLTLVNVTGCTLSLVLAWLLIPRLGITGAALGRLAYGPVTWLVYAKVQRLTRGSEAA